MADYRLFIGPFSEMLEILFSSQVKNSFNDF